MRRPDLEEFERSHAAHRETYQPSAERQPVDDARDGSGYAQHCPRCGRGTDRLVGVTQRGGGTRYVCEDCRREALAGDRSFWHWFHKE